MAAYIPSISGTNTRALRTTSARCQVYAPQRATSFIPASTPVPKIRAVSPPCRRPSVAFIVCLTPQAERDLASFGELHSRLKRTNVYFVGMMGCGKSSVAQLFAKYLSYRYLDTDQLIEKVTRTTIREIFAEQGEAKFRELESAILQEVCSYTNTVVSTGGGIVVQPHNWSYLQSGLVVWIDVPVPILYERLRDDVTRPLLQVKDPEGELQKILDKRQKMYENADVRIEVNSLDMGVEAVAREACRQLNNFIKSHPPRFADVYPGGLEGKSNES